MADDLSMPLVQDVVDENYDLDDGFPPATEMFNHAEMADLMARPVGVTPAPSGVSTPGPGAGDSEAVTAGNTTPGNAIDFGSLVLPQEAPAHVQSSDHWQTQNLLEVKQQLHQAFKQKIQDGAPDALLRQKYGHHAGMIEFAQKLIRYFPPADSVVYNHSYKLPRVNHQALQSQPPFSMHPTAISFSP